MKNVPKKSLNVLLEASIMFSSTKKKTRIMFLLYKN